MLALLPHLIWATVAVYAIQQAVAVAAAHRAMDPDKPSHLPPVPVEVPEDLVALASQERELWAQEETLRAMRERYDALGDWNKVRSAFGIGRRD